MMVRLTTVSPLVVSIFLLFGNAAMAEAVAEKSPYMGGEVHLTKAPNGAVVRDEVLTTSRRNSGWHLDLPSSKPVKHGVIYESNYEK